MKILHIMPNCSDIVNLYIRFINDYFNIKQHHFIFFYKDESVQALMVRYENVRFTTDKNIINLFKEYDKVIFHSLFTLSGKNKLKLLVHPFLIKKIIWVAWGADIYQWKIKDYTAKAIIRNIFIYFFIAQIRYFVGIFPPDVDFFKKEFKSKAKAYYAPYVDGLYNSLYKKELNSFEKRENNSCINVQVGHNATTILNHIEVLKDLYNFKDENIKIYIPLSYGDMEYRDQVEEEAKLLFGDKAICIRDMMNKEDYMDFLSTIDIAIFNTPRQIGLGNILPLLYMGKKIFIPSGSIMADFYKANGIEIYDYNKIRQINFEEFIEPVDGINGRKYIKQNIQNKKKIIEMWSKVFSA